MAEDDMSAKRLPLTIIVAATPSNGIGQTGGLPWPMLKKDMAYFARVTKRVPTSLQAGETISRRNVVIMGRKTWESIPPRLRPLKDRTNVVISTQTRTQLELPEDVILASSIISGLEALDRRVASGDALPVGRAFVIGGSSIYRAALELAETKHLLMTSIDKDFECDTKFPVNLNDPSSGWQRQSHDDLQKYVDEDVAAVPVTEGENGQAITYEFRLYERSSACV